jgi:hypothetical protein
MSTAARGRASWCCGGYDAGLRLFESRNRGRADDQQLVLYVLWSHETTIVQWPHNHQTDCQFAKFATHELPLTSHCSLWCLNELLGDPHHYAERATQSNRTHFPISVHLTSHIFFSSLGHFNRMFEFILYGFSLLTPSSSSASRAGIIGIQIFVTLSDLSVDSVVVSTSGFDPDGPSSSVGRIFGPFYFCQVRSCILKLPTVVIYIFILYAITVEGNFGRLKNIVRLQLEQSLPLPI